MKKRTIIFVTLIMVLALGRMSESALHDRGNGLIYDDGLDITWMENANSADITMTWDDAMAWVDALLFQGYQDWRLPASDTSCTGSACTGSEMGHLFFIDGITPETPGLFSDLKNYLYWSGTEDPADNANAWRFNFRYGTQDVNTKTSARYVWAVRDGDVTPAVAPEPVSTLLFLSGGGVLATQRLWRKRYSMTQ
ncbi:MAG: DUF1566 domain-containing protein [Nitrospiraceae bacterium]|nr:MAG: DUF1566 domain-containing protein [Nitrospiraceae bacterium]